ncbi:Undecaprenyl-phosphate alpha-N-acetylglucosaminyl 1-phosphate transferase [hydrothermal vent metagenome]|uniref:Undecaprenyl-phosphate alpha-N-acetylglucosaminyl 1-phosphate transferase n=1 Tax=hydrothermal vent metagenome TaxID=652676 RepID=A0A3B0YBF8_9ZZZZ
MVISMTIVPIMIRLAPRIGMVDLPDPRKVHTTPIPRVGGIGIVIGSIVPIVFWLPFEPVITSYIFGCLVLLIFGVWDDSCELGHYVKFIGQFVAVLPAVYYADLYVATIPLIGDIPEVVGKAFTVIAIVGMINATNHSDGLDGLAGGLSLLSLACIGYFMYMVGDTAMIFLVVSVMGGVFGFLRFNSHPAKVFMGDGGSQFLGFSLGFLVIVLTHKSNPALSPALPLLILGLPVVDILAVFYLRISGGMNWFKATRNHIHHRLLDLGFTHYESVIIIYLVQTLLILCSILFMYDYDWLILSIYFTVVISVFIFLTVLERRGFKLKRADGASVVDGFINKKLKSKILLRLLGDYIVFAVALVFLSISFAVDSVPADIGYLSLGLIILVLLVYIGLKVHLRNLAKLILFVTAAFVVYLDFLYLHFDNSFNSDLETTVYALMAAAVIMIIKFDDTVDFSMSPLDYLMAILVVIALTIFNMAPENNIYGDYMLKIIILFYGCELIEKRNLLGFKAVTVTSLLALAVLAFRSFA